MLKVEYFDFDTCPRENGDSYSGLFMTTAYIGLGSNLGDREGYINSALKLLADNEYIELIHTSDIIETPPLAPPPLVRGKKGGEARRNQPKYLNAVAEIKTNLTAEDVHKKLLEVETALGRGEKNKWSSRIIDLDLLLFGEQIINNPDLTVPHAQMHLRSFVLKGLCQLKSSLIHPVIREPVNVLADRLNGQDFVLNPDIPQLVSVAGIIGIGKTTLAKKLSDLLNCKCIFEAYDKNPFLPDVYAGKKESALDSQLFFLNSRIEQLNNNVLVKGQLAITDYVFDKELIYANRLLDARQLTLYKKTYPPLAEKATQPVLVIYLQDTPKNCLNRIHERNRPYEQKIVLQFLEDLHRDYQQLFANWKTSPVIRKQISQFDCRKNKDLQNLANQLKYYVADTATDRRYRLSD